MSLHFGRHFWIDEEHELCSCPTFTDGRPDTANWDYVSEWTELEDVDLSKLFAVHRSLVITDVFNQDRDKR
jgi:hypothetical protein